MSGGIGAVAATALGVLALAAGSTASAQECSTTCARYDQGQCVEYLHSCTTAPAVPAPSYGAIAYGRTSGAWGYSYRWGSRATAERVATQNCAKHGDDCEVLVWFDRKCGAVVAGTDSAAYWGLGDSDSQARADARNKCIADGGNDCDVRVSACSR